jgi:EmrB/QacA subfamily drug resistance transporter
MFMVMLDVTVVNVALPSIQHSLGGNLSHLEWVVNGYVLALAVGLLTGGRLADLVGRRLIFIIGLGLFTGASLTAGLSDSNTVLIASRLVQGCGAALVVPASLSIISATFPPKERGTAIGIWSAVTGFGVAIGPLIGGLLSEGINWNSIFFINVPIGAAAIVAALMLIDESKDETSHKRLDAPGLVVAAIGLGTLTYALVEANNYGWGSTTIVSLLVVAGVALVGFFMLETRQQLPMLDLSLFRNRTFSGAIATSGILGFAMTGVFFFLSLYMQNVQHFSPIEAGAAFLPMTMLMMVIPPIAGVLTDRFGPRWLLVVGMCLFAIGLFLFSGLGAGDGFWELLPGMLFSGAGVSMLFGPVTAAALSGAPIHKAGIASGVLNTSRQTGGSLGVAVMGAIIAQQAAEAVGGGRSATSVFIDGYQTAMTVGAGVAVLGALVAALTIRGMAVEGVPGDPGGEGGPGGPGGPPSGAESPQGAWRPGVPVGAAGDPRANGAMAPKPALVGAAGGRRDRPRRSRSAP